MNYRKEDVYILLQNKAVRIHALSPINCVVLAKFLVLSFLVTKMQDCTS